MVGSGSTPSSATTSRKACNKRYDEAYLTTGIVYTRKRSALLNLSLCPLACVSFTMLGLGLIIESFSINDGNGNYNIINSSYRSYQRFSHINEANGSHSTLLTLKPCLHVAVSKEDFARGRNWDNSY